MAIAVVLGTATAVAADDGPELIPGGTFDGTVAPWWTTSDMVARNGDGRLCVDVPGGTSTAWSSIVGVDNVPVVSGEDYDFSFTVVAVSPSPVVIRALIQQPVSPWAATYEANPSVGGTESDFSYKFTSGADLPAAQVVFQIGGAAAPWSFCLDDVSLHTGEPAAAYVPETGTRVRVNQLGYLPMGPKHATLMTEAKEPLPWTLRNSSGAAVATGTTEPRGEDYSAGSAVQVIDFGGVTATGTGYTIEADGETSYPFAIDDDIYSTLRYDALDYFHLVRSGIAIATPGYERPAGHLDVAPNTGDTSVGCAVPVAYMQGWTCDYRLDVRGGWYDAGDHGKYVVNGGIAVYQLLSTYERTLTATTATAGALDDGSLDVPEAGNGVPDVLDEARWELEFMLRMQVPDSEPLAGMVHHKVQDDDWTGLPLLPSDDPELRELHRPSTAATLNLAAVAAKGSRLFEKFDPDFAATLLAASRRAWAAAEANPELYAPPADGNDGGGAYDDKDVSDEFYWAASELYLTTGEQQFEDALNESPWSDKDLFLVGGFSWGSTAALGRLDLATVPSKLKDAGSVRASIVDLADEYLEVQGGQNFGQPYAPNSGYVWGSNSAVLNNAVVLATAFDLTGTEKYSAAVVESMDYLLGRNAMNNSYVTGYGTVFSHNQHSRWFAHELNPALPSPPNGTLAGGPNSTFADPLAQQTFNEGCADQQCYLDDIQSFSTNEMAVNWNSALAWVASFVDDQRTVKAPTTEVRAVSWLPVALGGGALVLAVGGILFFVFRRRRTQQD